MSWTALRVAALQQVSNYLELELSEASLWHVAVEVALLLAVIWLLFRKSYKPDGKPDKLSEQEINQMVEEWEPKPLVPTIVPDSKFDEIPVVTGAAKIRCTVNGRENVLNLVSYNFLGFVGNKRIEDVAISTVRRYGVGSCGPRGFYGTIDVHLELEQALAKFMKQEEAIIYAYGFSTIASVIPAYSKRGDVIFVDEGVCFSIQQGLVASRSTIRYFKHNDLDDLERLLKEQAKVDSQNPVKAQTVRRFLVIEGLYANYGDIPPLKRMIELKYKYKVRIFVEESMSFGVLGATGRGITEHTGVDRDDIDLICASMANALGSVGGFCVGRAFVVDHQRLSGQGYCFSASLPPLLATSATLALTLLEEKGAQNSFQTLAEKASTFRRALSKASKLRVVGDAQSPIVHLYLKSSTGKRRDDEELLQEIVRRVFDKGIIITQSKYIEAEEKHVPPPSIRLIVSLGHDDTTDLEVAAKAIVEVAQAVL